MVGNLSSIFNHFVEITIDLHLANDSRLHNASSVRTLHPTIVWTYAMIMKYSKVHPELLISISCKVQIKFNSLPYSVVYAQHDRTTLLSHSKVVATS